MDNVKEHSRWQFDTVQCVFLILNIGCHGWPFLGLGGWVYKKMANSHFSWQVEYGCHSIPKSYKKYSNHIPPKTGNFTSQALPADKRKCPVRNIVEYIKASEKFRKSKNLLKLWH